MKTRLSGGWKLCMSQILKPQKKALHARLGSVVLSDFRDGVAQWLFHPCLLNS